MFCGTQDQKTDFVSRLTKSSRCACPRFISQIESVRSKSTKTSDVYSIRSYPVHDPSAKNARANGGTAAVVIRTFGRELKPKTRPWRSERVRARGGWFCGDWDRDAAAEAAFPGEGSAVDGSPCNPIRPPVTSRMYINPVRTGICEWICQTVRGGGQGGCIGSRGTGDFSNVGGGLRGQYTRRAVQIDNLTSYDEIRPI